MAFLGCDRFARILFLTCIVLFSAMDVVAFPQVENCLNPLINAIHKPDLRLAEKLISARLGLDEVACMEATTPLIAALSSGYPGIAKAIIIAGANPNLADHNGSTPLHAASFKCYSEIVSILLSYGAKVDRTDKDDSTPLVDAAYQCSRSDVVRLLLRAGANKNKRTRQGQTPLIAASFAGNRGTVELLVAAGADTEARDGNGRTALEIALNRRIGRRTSHDEIAAILSAAAHRRTR